jgi:hypothetical protein
MAMKHCHRISLAVPAMLAISCGGSPATTASGGAGGAGGVGPGGSGGEGGGAAWNAPFATPEPVTIEGWNEDTMEPFLSRDGALLFFNNSNAPTTDTNLHWAERVDDLRFAYRGEIANANTASLDGVASMDATGAFYFVSLRTYATTLATVYKSQYADGALTGVELVAGISTETPGEVNFDADISADGATLYLVDGRFEAGNPIPTAGDIVVVNRVGTDFVRGDPALTATINTGALEYAPTSSADGRELFFTRLDAGEITIHVARRATVDEPFGLPERIDAIEGTVEGPTVAPDGRSLYFHKHDGERFVLFRVTR